MAPDAASDPSSTTPLPSNTVIAEREPTTAVG